MESNEQASSASDSRSESERLRSWAAEDEPAMAAAAAVLHPPIERLEDGSPRPRVQQSQISEVVLLRGKLSKQSALISKLVDANRSWERYCRVQSDAHDGRLLAAAAQVGELQNALAESRASEERLRATLERQTAAATEQQLAAEEVHATLLARVASLSQRPEAFAGDLSVAARAAAVCSRAGSDGEGDVAQSHRLAAAPTASPDETRANCDGNEAARPAAAAASQEVADELGALRLQISTLEEDFASERWDKERERERSAAARRQCEKLTQDNLHLQQKLSAAQSDLARVRQERQQLRRAVVQRQRQATADDRQPAAARDVGAPPPTTQQPAAACGRGPLELLADASRSERRAECAGCRHSTGAAAVGCVAAIVFGSSCAVVTACRT